MGSGVARRGRGGRVGRSGSASRPQERRSRPGSAARCHRLGRIRRRGIGRCRLDEDRGARRRFGVGGTRDGRSDEQQRRSGQQPGPRRGLADGRSLRALAGSGSRWRPRRTGRGPMRPADSLTTWSTRVDDGPSLSLQEPINRRPPDGARDGHRGAWRDGPGRAPIGRCGPVADRSGPGECGTLGPRAHAALTVPLHHPYHPRHPDARARRIAVDRSYDAGPRPPCLRRAVRDDDLFRSTRRRRHRPTSRSSA